MMTTGGVVCADGAELGNRDLEVGQQLEQIAFELLVGAIDLVDEQDRRPLARRSIARSSGRLIRNASVNRSRAWPCRVVVAIDASRSLASSSRISRIWRG